MDDLGFIRNLKRSLIYLFIYIIPEPRVSRITDRITEDFTQEVFRTFYVEFLFQDTSFCTPLYHGI